MAEGAGGTTGGEGAREGMAGALAAAAAAFPSLEVAATGGRDSVLVRLAPTAHAEDIADEIYEVVAAGVRPGHSVVLLHAIVDGRPALELVAEDPGTSPDDLRSAIGAIVAEFDRLVALWHPHLPTEGA